VTEVQTSANGVIATIGVFFSLAGHLGIVPRVIGERPGKAQRDSLPWAQRCDYGSSVLFVFLHQDHMRATVFCPTSAAPDHHVNCTPTNNAPASVAF